MKRRVLTVGLALLLAVLGTAGVLAYVHQADARAVAGMKAVTALVAEAPVPSGTSASAALSDGLLRSEKLPASSVPSSAVRSITPDLAGLVMSADVQPGQLLLRPMLVTAAQATGGVALPAGMIAVTIALCMPEAVAGAVRAGSEVEVFDTAAATTTGASGGTLTAGPNCTGPHQQQANGHARTRVVLAKVQVLSVGSASNGQGTSTATTTASTPANANGSTQGNVLVTLAVSQRDARKVIQITETGLPYLALLQPQA